MELRLRRRGVGWARPVLAAAVVLATASAGRPDDPPAMVAFALDTSGSVGARHLSLARDLALGILSALPEGSEVAVLAFDDQSRVVVPRTSRPDEVRERLARLKVGGRYTALYDALYDASRYVRATPGQRKAIVLITDGQDENSALDLDDGLRLAVDAHIPVFAVGVGPHPQERVLRRMAKLTAGDYVAFDAARGPALAARIAALPAEAEPSAARTAANPAAVGGGGAPREAAVPLASLPAAHVRVGATRLAWAAIGLLVVVGLGLLLARGLKRPAHACPTCGRALPAEGGPCPSCAAAPTRVPGRPAARARESAAEADDALSPTVLARMNTTEEYLERTVTLQEKPVLAVTRGPGTGQVFELSPTSATSIGRSRANDIQVEDVSVSSQHCRVRPEDGRFVLHDLKSTNGTLVNERRVSRHILEEGDVIAIGETALQFRREMKRG